MALLVPFSKEQCTRPPDGTPKYIKMGVTIGNSVISHKNAVAAQLYALISSFLASFSQRELKGFGVLSQGWFDFRT